MYVILRRNNRYILSTKEANWQGVYFINRFYVLIDYHSSDNFCLCICSRPMTAQGSYAQHYLGGGGGAGYGTGSAGYGSAGAGYGATAGAGYGTASAGYGTVSAGYGNAGAGYGTGSAGYGATAGGMYGYGSGGYGDHYGGGKWK